MVRICPVIVSLVLDTSVGLFSGQVKHAASMVINYHGYCGFQVDVQRMKKIIKTEEPGHGTK
jgi:hypothetical protein